jgi:predicted amidohydrolase YtcJ
MLPPAGIVSLAAAAVISDLSIETSRQQRDSHTVYYVHGRIYTNDPALPWAEAWPSRREGSAASEKWTMYCRLRRRPEGVETVQLRGQFLMPGFNDAHVHLGGAAADLLAVPLTGVPSAEEMQSVLPMPLPVEAGGWLPGGWDHTLERKRFPNRQQSMPSLPESRHPHAHLGHVAVNSLALKSAEIDKTRPIPGRRNRT